MNEFCVKKGQMTHVVTRKERKGRDSYAAVAAVDRHFRAAVAAATPNAALARLRPSTALLERHNCFLLFLPASKKQSSTQVDVKMCIINRFVSGFVLFWSWSAALLLLFLALAT